MFQVGRVELPYSRSRGYNTPALNERTVELPLAQYFIVTGNRQNLLEIGAVTPYHFGSAHVVIDPTDPHAGCVRQDARLVDYRGKEVLSLSTVEHIGNGEFDGGVRDNSAFDLVARIASESPRFLISFPLGYNANLDVSVRTSRLPRVVLGRLNAENEWAVTESFDFCYNHPYNNANAVCFVTNVPDLLAGTAG
jgi:hypothetical protein